MGSVLYRSAARSRAGSGLEEFAFDTGSIAVTPGPFYVAFLSVSEMASQADSAFTMPTARHAIPGNFFFQNNGHDFGRLTAQSWTPQNEDAYLKVRFATASAVPEQESWGLLLAGLGITGAAIRRRRLFPQPLYTSRPTDRAAAVPFQAASGSAAKTGRSDRLHCRPRWPKASLQR